MEKITTGGPHGPVHERIGDVAGRVWRQLRAHGPAPTQMIARTIGMPEAEVHQAVGWLAREGKIRMDSHDGKVALVEREMSIAL